MPGAAEREPEARGVAAPQAPPSTGRLRLGLRRARGRKRPEAAISAGCPAEVMALRLGCWAVGPDGAQGPEPRGWPALLRSSLTRSSLGDPVSKESWGWGLRCFERLARAEPRAGFRDLPAKFVDSILRQHYRGSVPVLQMQKLRLSV